MQVSVSLCGLVFLVPLQLHLDENNLGSTLTMVKNYKLCIHYVNYSTFLCRNTEESGIVDVMDT